MRVVFMGSPEFAVPTLRALVEKHEVALVGPAGQAGGSRWAADGTGGEDGGAAARIDGIPAGVGEERRARARTQGERGGDRDRRRVRQDLATRGARRIAAWVSQRARLAAAEVSRGRACAMGGDRRRAEDRCVDHAAR